jgi:hypothetical protein
VGANVVWGKPQDVLTNPRGGCLELGGQEARGHELASVIHDDNADQALFVAAWVGKDPTDDTGPHNDGAQHLETRRMLVDGLAAHVRLLELERDGNGGRGRQGRVREGHGLVILEEPKVAEAQLFGHVCTRHVGVLAGPYPKKEGADGELGCDPSRTGGERQKRAWRSISNRVEAVMAF